MKSYYKFTFFLIAFSIKAQAQIYDSSTNQVDKYWVVFTDKESSNFNPFEYFDEQAIERRMLQQLPLFDWYDLPLNATYVHQVERIATSIKTKSRWLNAVVVFANELEIEAIKRLNFVKSIEKGGDYEVLIAGSEGIESTNNSEVLNRQTERMGIARFEAEGLTGKGVRIAIFDVGYNGAQNHPAFKHIYEQNNVKLTYDFVKNREDVYSGGSHGTAVWSCIGGKLKDGWSGFAHDAEFLLARTEKGLTEPFSEEENWIAAAEWADKNGADIINSSLGYTNKRYFPTEMDGKTSFVTRGANIAASKGILVVNAAGNEGSVSWKVIGAPADADSVLTVGGVIPCCDRKSSFSSFGPSADGRLKPNVMAQGTVFCAKPIGEGRLDGTSFASPLAAGFAACAWQSDKSLKNMDLFKKLEKSCSLYPYYDYAHGYGVLNASNFLNERVEVPVKLKIKQGANNKTLEISILEKIKPSDDNRENLLYVAFCSKDGKPNAYRLVDLEGNQEYKIELSESELKSDFVRVHYSGYFEKLELKK